MQGMQIKACFRQSGSSGNAHDLFGMRDGDNRSVQTFTGKAGSLPILFSEKAICRTAGFSKLIRSDVNVAVPLWPKPSWPLPWLEESGAQLFLTEISRNPSGLPATDCSGPWRKCLRLEE